MSHLGMTSEKPGQFRSSSSAGGEDTNSTLGLSRLAGTLQGAITRATTVGGDVVERYLPAPKRERWVNQIVDFARRRPYVAGFLASQIVFGGLPLSLFICTTVSVFFFSILAGILVGIIGGLLFVVPVVGFGLLILVPVLFFTTAAAVCVWFWGVIAYTLIDWFNREETSGQDVKVKDGSSNGTPYETKQQGTKIQSALSNSVGTPKGGDDSGVNHQTSSSDGGIQSQHHTPSDSTSTSNSSGGGSGADSSISAPQQLLPTENHIRH